MVSPVGKHLEAGNTGEFTIEAQGVSYPVEKKLLCDIDTIISKGDKVVIDYGGGNESQFMVLRVDKKQAFEGHHTSCLLGRIEEKE